MFPDAEDAPAAFAEFPVYTAVAGFVGSELLLPERPIIPWRIAVLRAAVPKAPVHKDGDALLGENEVGLAKDGLMTAPAGDVVLTEQLYQGELGILIATAADARHDLGSLGLGEDVGHGTKEKQKVENRK